MSVADDLLAWYRRTRRDFPWRHTTDPWAILTVEVMSQQTQIDRVLPKWEAWMDRFPTPAACADADNEEVLALWSGLGYNSRALRLKAAAAMVATDGWPLDVDGLQRLPGVGPYTAAAVACQAFDAQVPTVDTNLRRVLSRWVGEALDGRRLAEVAADLLPMGEARDWNQALMDLGATVCLPKPRCDACPVAASCTDPTVYQPPPRQGRFEGSRRQLRGAIMRRLLQGPAGPDDLCVDAAPARIDEALGHMADEGLVEFHAGRWRIA